MAAEPPGLVQGETSGLGLRGNQELSGNTVGSPEHSALWAPDSTWVAHAVRETQHPVSHSTRWPKVRDKRTRTRTHREDKPSITEPVAPSGKAKLPILEGGARERLRYVMADSSAVSDIPERTHASESAKPKGKETAFHLA